ncbi:MAG: zf-HC2 domain-containing protein [Sphingomonas sp.]
MGNLVHLRGDPHEETQKLLPWYVIDRLDATDRMIVDAHLAECEECRADLAMERRLQPAVADLPADADSGWDRLVADLRARPADPEPRRNPLLKRPVRVAWFVAAQAAVVLLVVTVLVQRQPEPAPYHALGDAPAPHTGNILAMFGANASEQDLRKALQASRTRLVDGPTATGAYVLTIAPDQRAAALATLRAQPGVTMAEPIDAAP